MNPWRRLNQVGSGASALNIKEVNDQSAGLLAATAAGGPPAVTPGH
jgi:hypothetical protein